jgi:hypothetical protein
MSIKLLAKVWTLKVSGTEREVLNAMCDHADDFGREARPSIAYIAWKVGCDERTVIRHIKKLREKKALLLERPARDHSPNVYRVDLSVYENKEEFVPKGDGYHATRTSERGDILSKRGDKLVSPKPSFESNNNNNNNPLQESWHKELEQLTGGYMGGGDAFRDLTDAWQRFPDVRRHTEAIRQTTAARSRTVVVYLKAFLTFNPDYVPPTYQKQSTYQRPKPGIGRASPPRAEAGPITPDEKEAKLREWVAARTKAGMDVPEKLRYLQVAA